MVKAVVLINVESNQTASAAEALAEVKGATDVYSVAGNYDLVVVLTLKDNEELADVVTGKIRTVPGITRTETLIAFRAYSKGEMENMASVD